MEIYVETLVTMMYHDLFYHQPMFYLFRHVLFAMILRNKRFCLTYRFGMTILCDEPPETIPDTSRVTSMDQHEWVVQDNPQLIS